MGEIENLSGLEGGMVEGGMEEEEWRMKAKELQEDRTTLPRPRGMLYQFGNDEDRLLVCTDSIELYQIGMTKLFHDGSFF